MKIGLDVGSTTLKCVVLDEKDNLIFHSYERHFSQIREKTVVLLNEIMNKFPEVKEASLSISGSAGMGMAEKHGVPFIQEVYATRLAVMREVEGTDVVIELGGEDAKILFLSNGLEVRMNGSCAGGTGAFIDQMATLMGISLTEMNDLSKSHEKQYTIASRCGVFAKSDIQPLLNQGASKSDMSASIFQAVVNQTIGGLAQGRPIRGKVVYLGGPLTFFSQLRETFNSTLGVNGICPENSLYFVAMGAAISDIETPVNLEKLIEKLDANTTRKTYGGLKKLFEDEEEYMIFKSRHDREQVKYSDPLTYKGNAYLGIDAGSTTIKAVIMDEEDGILHSIYRSNQGNPVPLIKDFLMDFYRKYPDITIKTSAVTGYGEELLKNAFSLDFGVVETIAHYTAAKKYKPEVDFIIDIGGQDIKCFKIRDGVIDSIFLNEACSSGCGSFLQTFAEALGYGIGEFANLGIYSKDPVDLGSRCTVFMNSSVKQAQKDGASIADISAGLSISVIKNALYKVIRASSVKDLGENIVVQGGTFYNDSVLKAFEDELERKVIRPNISGLMGAFGAAIYAKDKGNDHSSLLGMDELKKFNHQVKLVMCGLCENNCSLTVNSFGDNRKYIGGNRCDRPVKNRDIEEQYDIYDEKLKFLKEYKSIKGRRGSIGIPMALNMYEMLPFWHTVFTLLDFEVIRSPFTSRELFIRGQHTIPSDTVCFPAKLVHGHIEYLIDKEVDTIFYPCLTYNIDEKMGDNHFNCPIVAYYPEVIAANIERLDQTNFVFDYMGLQNKKVLSKKLYEILKKTNKDIKLSEVKFAVDRGIKEYKSYIKKIQSKGQEFIQIARENGKKIIVLAGRPYHVDPETNHGISKLITEYGVVVISEDSIGNLASKTTVDVLNQWTYHSRLYSIAEYVGNQDDMELVQLVSFGCGLDAITTDEIKAILEEKGKIYTQLKIDEITNLGAVRIRIRSLLSAIEQKDKEGKGYGRKS
ncbi:acyl-CoA dehydratase activase-related protein [Gudongella sp. DL1XJH-153]|uniref:acyl-CoA dehydratase activase-related protein n=1 Tax=Gudongella sp. DL1XJH-153 TaxID=3409804 RepID=UPI003BB6053D